LGTSGQVQSRVFSVQTGSSPAVLDLTREAADFVAGFSSGLLTVFIPHATAGIAVLELGSGSDEDLIAVLDDLLPADNRYRHRHGSPGHGRSHVMPAFISPSVVVPVIDGRLTLGTWQSLALVDLNVDNPTRSIRLSFIEG
jgi:secondary thiamine-phosphate synthase enzyme